jgi:N-acetylglucosaminyl-diphospho-decaprenol L-rhamnosyltransferase
LRGGDDLVELVRALAQDAEILVADNGLPAGTARTLRDEGASVLDMGRNRGFGGAVNRAVEAAGGDVLVVLNDDVVPQPGLVSALVDGLVDAEMAAGVLLRADRPHVIETAGIELDAALGPHDYLQGEPVTRLDAPVAPPVGPCGGAAAFRLDAFRSAGGFDEGFFAYFEDLDLALRLRAAGGRCALAAEARVLHRGSRTLGPSSLEKAALVGHSRGYFIRKYGVLAHPRSAILAVAAETAASVVLGVRHRSLEPARARIRGWRSCPTRAQAPPGQVTVRTVAAFRRRVSRSRL